MECAVCYDECSRACKLICGHVFCTACVKEWYRKGAGTGCPMCRRPMYFKGFHKARDAWDEEAYETRCTEILGETMESCIQDAFEMADYFPRKYRREILAGAVSDLREMEKTFRYLKSEGVWTEDIDYVLNETDDYYSDRRTNPRYIDEPVKELPPRCPARTSNRCGRRARARQDPWCTVSLIFEV